MLLGILATPLYAQRSRDRQADRPQDRDIDRRHDDGCLRAGILRNPDVLVVGERFKMVVGVQNLCRHIALVNVDIYLANDRFRVQIGSGQVVLDGPEAEMLYFRPVVPRRIRAGRYSLVMVASERGGSVEFDRTAVLVENRHRPDHLELQADGGPLNDLATDLGAAEPVPFSGDCGGVVTHLTEDSITVEQTVGPTMDFEIDAATVVVDRDGNPATVYKDDRVTVEYTGDHADKIIITG
jgi:hypothetical protein